MRRFQLRLLAALTLVAFFASTSACTVVNTVRVPSDRSGKQVFVSAGDIPEPYESLGIIQVKRGGVLLFGFADPVGTDLEAGFQDSLIPEIQRMGGDGAVNVTFHQTQYLPITKAMFVIFFFVPLPSQVVITAEVVKLK